MNRYSNFMLCAFGMFALTTLPACKDEEEEVPDTPLICGLPNGTIKWKENGVEKCANANIVADNAIILTIYGLSAQGPSITFELDSVSVGTHELTADYNYMLYTDGLALAWEATNEQPGSITITSHNESTNRIEGTFQINVVNPLNGVTKQITDGQLSVTYTE
jgi:hypothetical protein